MPIPANIKIENGPLPPRPGVYVFRGEKGRLLYIGKATSLKTRVNSHFVRPFDGRIAKMTTEVRTIEFIETPTAIEALMLESRMIQKRQPYYNILSKDDKSSIYLVFTKEDFPRPVLIRQHELDRTSKARFLKILGPFASAGSVQAALDAVRNAFPWSECRPPKGDSPKVRPCFYRHLRQCPGVCTGEIGSNEYKRIIRQLIRFLEGGRTRVVSEMERAMKRAAKDRQFEEAAEIRDRLNNLKQVRDLAVIKCERPEVERTIDLFGRIEGYDISHISGQDTVGSMAVFVDGRPKKSAYRKFKIKSVRGPDDTRAMAEMLERRFRHSFGEAAARRRTGLGRLSPTDGGSTASAGRPASGQQQPQLNCDWPLPDLILVDGGVGQVNAAKRVLDEFGLDIPLVGLAKGPDRKRDELVYHGKDKELIRLVTAFRSLLRQLRDEAHRFAVGFHRQRRSVRARPTKFPPCGRPAPKGGLVG